MPKMKDSGIEWIGEIPESWELIKIAGLYSLRNTKVSDNDYPPLSVTMKGVVPQLETAAKTNDHDNRKLVKKGDFAINSRSDRRGSCGVSEYDGSVSLINTVMKPNRSMNSQYYNWLFHTSLFADEFYKWGHGIVDDLWTTTWQDMKKITVPFPTIEEQRIIADFLDKKCSEIDSLQANIEKEIETLDEYKKSVITEAVTKGLNPDVEMKDSGIEWIGMIPKHWHCMRLKHCLDEHTVGMRVGPFGSALAGSDIQEHGIWVYNQRCVLDKNFSTNDTFIGEEKYKELKSFEVFENDILITTRGSIGKVAVVPKNAPKGVLHPCIIKFIPNQKIINSRLIEYIFNNSDIVLNQILYKSNSTTIEVIYSYSLKEIYLPIMPLVEQKEIVKHLDEKCTEIDDAIAEKKIQLEILTEYKKSLIYEYVTGKKEVPSKEVPANEELNKNAVILGIIADKLGEQQAGRIQLQKVHFMMTMCVMMSQKAQYYRYNHGPYDVCLNDYIDILLKNKWYQEKKGGAYILVKGEKHSEFLNTYKELIEKLEPEVDKLLNMLKSMNVLKTSRMERIATLYAAWNDLLLDGVSPTDDQIIEEVMNNWTENKGNTQYVTWQGSLEKMKKNGLIPKGTGKHTLPKQQ